MAQVLGASFPTELTAAPSGGKVAWVSNSRGVRNILVAEPLSWQARKITAYTSDDGQEIANLRWTASGSAILYVRGGSANPALNAQGVSQDIWVAELNGAPPRKLATGNEAAIAPDGKLVAYIAGGQVSLVGFDGKPVPSFHARGTCSRPEWSPDGERISFVSARGDHSFIGVYNVAAGELRYLDPSTDNDSEPVWSPDGRSIAFLREPSTGKRAVREARRAGEPWSIRIASVETGEGHELWRAGPGPGSVFRNVTAANQLAWTADGRIVFPWERDGWTHLYSVAVSGGKCCAADAGRVRSRGCGARRRTPRS